MVGVWIKAAAFLVLLCRGFVVLASLSGWGLHRTQYRGLEKLPPWELAIQVMLLQVAAIGSVFVILLESDQVGDFWIRVWRRE